MHKFFSMYLFLFVTCFEHDVLETCRELQIEIKYIEKNLCITLVIYQESLHLYVLPVTFKHQNHNQNYNYFPITSTLLLLLLK
jgi:hypothetical protein